MGIKYSWMSFIYPCLKINAYIYPQDFLNKLRQVTHRTNALYFMDQFKKDENNLLLKVIVQQPDT